MTLINASHQNWRVLLVSLRSAVAFVALAFLVFWLYFISRGIVYDDLTREGLGSLMVLYYVVVALHLMGSAGLAAVFIRWTRSPLGLSLVAVGLTFIILTIAQLYVMTWFHVCGIQESFPMAGLPIDCGD